MDVINSRNDGEICAVMESSVFFVMSFNVAINHRRAKLKPLISIVVAAICFGASANSRAMDGHNGIRFEMTQKDLEEKGFVCNPPKEPKIHIRALCEHMDMTGIAFGFPTKDYRIIIGPSGYVDKIGAHFSGRISMADYLGLSSKIEHFFPKKYAPGTIYAKTSRIDEWRADNNASAVLIYFQGVPPVIDQSLSINFWSPRAMAEADKNNK